jgi:tRNA modification GTPase
VESPFDTIVAPITAPGGAVGILRLSGADSWAVAKQVVQPWPDTPLSHHAYRAGFENGDDGLMLLFADGKSYTGEETVELNIHGSSASMNSLLEQCIAAGARLARPGEFTERAFLNGKLDLTQAEAVNDTVRAATGRQLSIANAARDGQLRDELDALEAILVGQLTAIEASVDFSEEIGDVDTQAVLLAVQGVSTRIQNLIEQGERGRLVREGLRIAIVGPPNAGKSSLLNRILGAERAIVTEIAGTTRDYVEEQCVLGGMQCVLIDTAGLRDSDDLVESLGIQRTRTQAASADLVWYVYDAQLGITPQDQEEIDAFKKAVWTVANKTDVSPSSERFSVSTYTGQGIETLIQAISTLAVDVSAAVPNRRHMNHLSAAFESCTSAIDGLAVDHPTDLIVTHLRAAIYEIGAITGSTASQDILTRIFSQFCIGK